MIMCFNPMTQPNNYILLIKLVFTFSMRVVIEKIQYFFFIFTENIIYDTAERATADTLNEGRNED